MKPQPPHIPPPTPIASSAFSTHPNDHFKQHAAAPLALSVDFRAISRIHYDELHSFLTEYLAKVPANIRGTARQKLARLTRPQFNELTTDVYDEVVRRKNVSGGPAFAIPFLPVRKEFHPKRNQARQKLATLPPPRFKDLSSDVHFELGRRYPEFKEDVHNIRQIIFPKPPLVSRARL